MIDKAKLLQWIEKKRFVYTAVPGTMPDEDWHYCDGAMKILSLLNLAVNSDEFDGE